MSGMELTSVQRRTLEGLIGVGERPLFAAGLAVRLRDRIEEAVHDLELPEPLWLGKGRLNDHARCEGLFQAGLLGEGPPFEHSLKSAAGTLLHKAIEIDVGGRDEVDPHTAAARAAERLEEDGRFASYWRELDRLAQDEILMETVRRLTLFQASFPPLRDLRRELAPVSELRLRVELLGGALVLSGQVDLVLGRPSPGDPGRATRLAVDLKSGGAYPEYPEDMRFYALLLALRFGVPPYRVATLYLDSGEWQAEDVDARVLDRAAERVIEAVRAASASQSGHRLPLRAGPFCAWCPRAPTCPSALSARLGPG